MTPAKVGMWGSSGYLGTHLTAHLVERGYEVLALGRDAPSGPADALVDVSFPPNYKQRAVQLRYLRSVAARAAAAAAADQTYIYLGSTSSLSPVTSIYGRVKREAEDSVLSHGQHVVRAGLVTSSERAGGRFQQLVLIVGKLPLAPLPHGSTFRVLVSELTRTIECIEQALAAKHAPASDLLVPGTRECSLADLIIEAVPGQRFMHLSRRASSLAAILARHVHVGPLDSLSSLAARRG